MPEPIRIIGVHPIATKEPCHLVEIELTTGRDDFDFGSVTQEKIGQPQANWQVAYDEQEVGSEEGGSRWAFFFHYLDFEQPLLTQSGAVALPLPSALPKHLKDIEYYEP